MQWVSSMVAAHNKNPNEIHICIDPRNLNEATNEKVASQMLNDTVFSVLDAKYSFWQISLDKESSLPTTFHIPYGRFRFLRMPYGINLASEAFQ